MFNLTHIGLLQTRMNFDVGKLLKVVVRNCTCIQLVIDNSFMSETLLDSYRYVYHIFGISP